MINWKKNVPTNLKKFKSKVDKEDVDKLVLVSVNLSKISDVVKNDAVRKDVYNAKNKKNKSIKIKQKTKQTWNQ